VTAGHVVAIGGGTFWDDGSQDPRLDAFILSLARRERPRVCFVATASGDAEGYRYRFYRAMARHDCIPADLALFPRIVDDLAAFVAEQDVFWVGGGSTANLLALWRLHGLDALLREAHANGAVLAGVSAGMNCWFEASTTDSFGLTPAPLRDGLGLVPGSACPHYDAEPQRRPLYRSLVDEGFPPGYAVDNDVALVFREAELVEAMTVRAGAGAYRVEPGAETPIQARLL
jgi:dipeptidase E